eukprot:CAMPEP_0177680438 /NCGR_PEP_ID=MMETSP0447-20121125/30172_1 /TAXON_ID=0 /ORGANISM="Stygamoeba regulata, Strain BSH-02190019" /LENGTH=471 /DNA_ID=CAMNT_0019189767 /DNA_START=31 /DNA_END=1446 /DNA_ORIENTATION=+
MTGIEAPADYKYVDCGLSGLDSLFVHIETPEHLMTIAGLYGFKQRVSIEAIQQQFELMVERFPRFADRLDFKARGIPSKWVPDENFSMSNHVRETTLKAPRDPNTTFDEQLFQVVADLQSTPFNFDHPLWEAVLIRASGSDQCALYIKIHHIIADGQGCIRTLLSLCKPAPGQSSTVAQYGGRSAQQRQSGRAARPNLLVRLWSAFLSLLWMIVSFFIVMRKLNAISWYRRRGLRGRDTAHKHLAWTREIRVDEVKAVKDHFGVTLNDVLMACLAGALSDYFAKHEPDLRLEEMLAAIPVSMRRLDDWSLGNKVSVACLWLPSDLSPRVGDPVQRLREVHRRMNELKRSVEPPISYGWLSFAGKFPWASSPWFVKRLRSCVHKPHTVFTNVPGPMIQLEFAGAPMTSYVAFAPQSGGCGLGMAILTYHGQVALSVLSDRAVVPGVNVPKEITASFVERFREYQNLVEKKSK